MLLLCTLCAVRDHTLAFDVVIQELFLPTDRPAILNCAADPLIATNTKPSPHTLNPFVPSTRRIARRFCELTSWNVEIKCRQHDLQVDSSDPSAPADARQQANSVITGGPSRASKPSIDMVRLVDPPRGSHYETHIYDLRALTNYTFQVRVARFSHEPPVALAGQQPGDRSQAARRLGGSAPAARQELDWPPAEEGSSRVETKPFGAEATKCLSDVSEVVVNTGRYFGGRISVENSADPRCNLLGNKSSEQTSYLFRIEHEICDSKVVVS